MKKINFKRIINYLGCTLLIIVASCGNRIAEETHAMNIDMKIVAINYDCSLTDDKFRTPQLCNTILFVTLTEPKLYREINTCKDLDRNKIHIDTKWLYNHRVGDIVHFDYLLKSKFFTIDE